MHIGFIPDGNRRYSRKNLRTSWEGYYILIFYYLNEDTDCNELTLFMVSSKNFDRPKDEVDALMVAIEEMVKIFHVTDFNFNFIGGRNRFSKRALESLDLLCSIQTPDKLNINLLIDYDYQKDEDYKNQVENPIDLVIRTGNETRLSGFPMKQSAFAELFFSKKMFPEFTINDLDDIIKQFNTKDRRMGK